MHKPLTFITISLITTTLLLACGKHDTIAEQNSTSTRDHSMDNTSPWIEPEIFSTITANEGGRSACTPPDPTDRVWDGVIINAPTVVYARAGQPFFIPVCVNGWVRFNPSREPEPEEIIVATNIQTNKTYKGPAFIDQDDLDDGIEYHPIPNPYPPEPLTDEEIRNRKTGTTFTSELFGNAGLPAESAEYRVHYERGDLRSNEVIIKVVWEK